MGIESLDPIAVTTISLALVEGLKLIGKGLLEEGVPDLLAEPIRQPLQKLVGARLEGISEDRALRTAIQNAITRAGVAVDDGDAVQRGLKRMSFDALIAKPNRELRQQFALAVIAQRDPDAEPPHELVDALSWPHSQRRQLAQLLAGLRFELSGLDPWQAPIAYADRAAELGQWDAILAKLAQFDGVLTTTDKGDAIRVVIIPQGLTQAQAEEIEAQYRAQLVRDLRMHDFRGIVQMRQDIRLPLADIYLELGLLKLGGEEDHRRAQEALLALEEEERAEQEERRQQDRVSDALARAQRLVILGEPGSGKSISLRYVALMLAQGNGPVRFGLEAPFIPLMVRLADYARELEVKPALALDNFLLQAVQETCACHPQLGDFLRAALSVGACMILLDGLDEVGDDPAQGQSLRTRVVQRVQAFADRWCDDQGNRVVVTSRIEGYWAETLRGFEHVELSRLMAPDEVEGFLLRWYGAHERAHDSELSADEIERRAAAKATALMPQLMEKRGVRRLATNPLLLTILALMHDNVGKLPNRRASLYDMCSNTLIESWRQLQVGFRSALLAEVEEEKVIQIMAPLAYSLHEENPGGTMSYAEWQQRLLEILVDREGFEPDQARRIANSFLHHARYWNGLLAERSQGQYGFFHLTFEEYLAGWHLADQRAEARRGMLEQHWEDPRWSEVILLAAGVLGIVRGSKPSASDFIDDLLHMKPTSPENAGRQIILAGRALADIGRSSVEPVTRRWVLEGLRQTMQDLDPDNGHPNDPPVVGPRTRYAAGEALDELGWLPEDLSAWQPCPKCAEGGGDLAAMHYPVTNAQFERFIIAGGYDDQNFWGGKDSAGWKWRESPPDWRGEGPVREPEYWRQSRFGRERRGFPVVGVSWYEAAAYAAWLTGVLRRARAGDAGLPEEDRALVADLLEFGVSEIMLPVADEWRRMAGGTADKERYPWDAPMGPATTDEKAILTRCNVGASGIGGTSPVGMYPLGESRPHRLMDLGGNVWEWTSSWYDDGKSARVLAGGSWNYNSVGARCASRNGHYPDLSYYGIGFRLVSPIGSGS